MVNEENVTQNDLNPEYERAKRNYRYDGMKSLSPIAAISIITLIGLVCVIIDFCLESE